MNSKLFAPSFEAVNETSADRTIPVPFLPHHRVSRRTALWAVTIGVWPVVIARIFSAGARKRAALKK
ncbi:MAG TPA: hypothetical protein VHO24_20100 [Opitutaceae bacterium]|nr:hypothetical protein [Opitutaceae bacterium]